MHTRIKVPGTNSTAFATDPPPEALRRYEQSLRRLGEVGFVVAQMPFQHTVMVAVWYDRRGRPTDYLACFHGDIRDRDDDALDTLIQSRLDAKREKW